MTRSYRKTHIFPCCSGSEKYDKQLTNRRFRKINKKLLYNKNLNFKLIREISDICRFNKDGKYYESNCDIKKLRK
jgi:hypothetical protein